MYVKTHIIAPGLLDQEMSRRHHIKMKGTPWFWHTSLPQHSNITEYFGELRSTWLRRYNNYPIPQRTVKRPEVRRSNIFVQFFFDIFWIPLIHTTRYLLKVFSLMRLSCLTQYLLFEIKSKYRLRSFNNVSSNFKGHIKATLKLESYQMSVTDRLFLPVVQLWKRYFMVYMI